MYTPAEYQPIVELSQILRDLMPFVPLLSFVLSETPCTGLWALRPMT